MRFTPRPLPESRFTEGRHLVHLQYLFEKMCEAYDYKLVESATPRLFGPPLKTPYFLPAMPATALEFGTL